MEGKKEYCIGDARVSDPSQLAGGSLENQELLINLFAKKKGWEVVKVFRKPHSATTRERDDIDEIIDYIRNSDKPIHHYVCKSIDRFTRAGFSEYERLKGQLEKVGVQVWDTDGLIQPEKNTLEHLGVEYKWSKYSPNEGSVIMAVQGSKDEARFILTRMVGAQITYARVGWASRAAPDGLKNKAFFANGKERVIRIPDPERVHFLIKMFELRAAGASDPEIVSQLNAMGYKTRKRKRWDRSDKDQPRLIGESRGQALTVKQLQSFIQRTEYAGIIYEKWTKHCPIRAMHFAGIVSVDVFNRANRGKIFIRENEDNSIQILHNYSPWGKMKRMRNNPDYPWKAVLCSICKSEMLGSASRGKSGKKFPGYHCGGQKTGKRAHPGFRVPKQDFDNTIKQYFDSLAFNDDFLNKLEEKLIKKYREREKEIVAESSLVSHNIGDLKAIQAQKLDAFAFAESQITRKMLETQIEDLDREIKEAEGRRGQVEIGEKGIKAFIRYAKHVMEHPGEILTDADDLETRRALMSLFFEETPTYSEIVNGTPKLQPLFRLSETFKNDKSLLVTPPGIEPGLTA